jgi:cadmium resistance protein CadD (predicted permease)
MFPATLSSVSPSISSARNNHKITQRVASLLTLIGLAIVAFASTNVDDVFVLVSFLADKQFRARDVVIGQYAGVGALYATSGVAALVSLMIPSQYVGLLGLVPIAIGARKLWNPNRRNKKQELQGTSSSGAYGSLTVAAVTIANGGDNIAVYTALLASRGGYDILTIGVVFAIMTGLWCLAAHWFINHRALGAPIRRHAQRIVPFVLIGLGILILMKAGALRLWK